MKVELQFMPKAKKYRILIDGKSLPRRFSSRTEAMRGFDKRIQEEFDRQFGEVNHDR